jgi:uncharacterized BrkB/YihY/UPF0761 family membrane protein
MDTWSIMPPVLSADLGWRHKDGVMASTPPGGEEPTDPTDVSAGHLSALVARGKTRVGSEQERFNRLLAEHEHQPLIDVALRIYRRDRESAGTVVGSAIAFRLFLFFVPMLLFLVGVLGFLATWVDEGDVEEQTGLTGGLATQINSALTQPDSSRWIATILGLIGMATAGRSLSKVMVTASCLAWQLPVRTKASVRIIGGVVGLIVGIRTELGLAAAGLSFLAAFVIYGLAWMAMSTMLPRATNDPGALLPGAVIVGLTIAGMQAVSQLYLPDRLGRASELYGAIGTTIVTLGWFFILGRAMVLAMTVNAVIHERFGTISQFVFSLPVLRILPRKSAWIRRFFDLDTKDGNAGSP